MTFEEFKELAMNPPTYNGQTIFRVDAYCYYDALHYEYDLHRKHRSYHLSLEDAKNIFADVRSRIEDEGLKIYCFFVFEIPVGVDETFDRFISVGTYDADGVPEAQSVCSYGFSENGRYDAFRGRPDNMIRHKVGDFVEIVSLHEDEGSANVNTALITSVPKSIEKCWNIYQKLPDGFFLDWLDDQYFYIDEPQHQMWSDDVHPMFIFKPREPISDERKKELIEFSKDDSIVNNYWRENGSEKDHIVTRVAAVGNRYRPDGPQLEPDDFLPVYGAKEIFDTSISVDCSTPDPFNALTDKLLAVKPDIFEHFTHFLINFIDTDIKEKKLKLPARCKWWQELQRRFTRLGNFPNRKFGHRICRGATEYRIEIIAYK